ncbi:PH-domain-containing protein [Xylariaceae sp. FL1272]|nr:PH-domain-containing protein [Xylariaceae sp. FL1272]
MADTTTQCIAQPAGATPNTLTALAIPPTSISLPPRSVANRLKAHIGLSTLSPVTQHGSFEFDRVIKSGYVHKRTQKTKAGSAYGFSPNSPTQVLTPKKTWKSVYLVLRPNTISMYKSDKESKLRHKIYLSDLSAVAPLKDPKQKRQHLFGLFSPAKNYHFEAPTDKDAQEWIDLIRKDARIEEEEEEMFLASPVVRRQSFAPAAMLKSSDATRNRSAGPETLLSSSPEADRPRSKSVRSTNTRRLSHNDYSGMSGNELASQSDCSDTEGQRGYGPSIEGVTSTSKHDAKLKRPMIADRNISQVSGLNLERDPDRVIWQGWLWYLKGKRGMRQWKNCWAVLRPRNFILYKDESEYAAQFILALASVVNVVDIDPISKTKIHCLQIITDEKSYRFCAPDEESLVQCLGAFKSLFSKRKELEARVSVSGQGQTNMSTL